MVFKTCGLTRAHICSVSRAEKGAINSYRGATPAQFSDLKVMEEVFTWVGLEYLLQEPALLRNAERKRVLLHTSLGLADKARPVQRWTGKNLTSDPEEKESPGEKKKKAHCPFLE